MNILIYILLDLKNRYDITKIIFGNHFYFLKIKFQVSLLPFEFLFTNIQQEKTNDQLCNMHF